LSFSSTVISRDRRSGGPRRGIDTLFSAILCDFRVNKELFQAITFQTDRTTGSKLLCYALARIGTTVVYCSCSCLMRDTTLSQCSLLHAADTESRRRGRAGATPCV
jgi:hypothetical protein